MKLNKKQTTPGPILIRWDSRQPALSASPRKQLHLDQVSLDFQDEKSLLYFQEFVHLAQGPWIAAGSNGNFWAVSLPQIARNNNIVRHAAIGIGALSKWFSDSGHKDLRTRSMPLTLAANEDSHYFTGVAHYCHALKLQSQQTTSSLQDAVFLSIFFLCFETLRGNRKAALDHINHGMAILLSLLTDQDSRRLIASVAPDPRPVLAVLAEIITYLAGQARFILRGTVGRSPMLPNLAKALKQKKHTMESFIVLSNQLKRSPVANRSIPNVFDSLSEFEEYWAAAITPFVEMGPVLLEIVKDSGILGSDDQSVINKYWKSLSSDPRVKNFCEVSLKQMHALNSAFLPLFDRIMMFGAESPDYLRALHLRLQYLSVYAFENPLQYYDPEILRAQTPIFREYLSVANLALRTAERDLKNPAQQLSLQCGLSWCLLLVAFFCRDPLVRDEATLMLKDYPGQDGIWNARSLYVLALKNQEVERMNATEGSPMEQWHRLWRREYLFENGGDSVVFCYLEKDETTEGWQVVEETVDVQGNLEDVCWQRRPLTASGKLLIGDIITLWEESL